MSFQFGVVQGLPLSISYSTVSQNDRVRSSSDTLTGLFNQLSLNETKETSAPSNLTRSGTVILLDNSSQDSGSILKRTHAMGPIVLQKWLDSASGP